MKKVEPHKNINTVIADIKVQTTFILILAKLYCDPIFIFVTEKSFTETKRDFIENKKRAPIRI